jgi:Polyketide cyclase / dehydrase and lipid transport
MPTATHGEASAHITASPEAVYDLIADVTRIGERSPECYRAEWVGEVISAEVGARFRGHNRIGFIKWATTCKVTAAERGREFAFSVVDRHGREETRWRYLISADDGGCTVTESYQFLWCPLAARIAEIPFPRDRQLRRGIRETLAGLKAAVELSTSGRAPRLDVEAAADARPAQEAERQS